MEFPKDYKFEEERGFETKESGLFKYVDKIFISLALGIICLFSYNEHKIFKAEPILKKVLIIADRNNNKIIEQSELADLIKEMEPDYIMPQLSGFDIRIDNRLSITGKPSQEIYVGIDPLNPKNSTTLVLIPINKLEKYLEQHK